MRQRANEARKWTPKHFLDTLKGLKERMEKSDGFRQKPNDFDFDMSSFQGSKDTDVTSGVDKDREMFRSLLSQIQIEAKEVHIRYEDDYFSE